MIIGQQLLHYRIETQLGVGGMGEVYQALDTKLGRSVAVKVLPENLALDPERISRFQREAKLLASPITKTLLRCMDWSKRAADIFW